MKQKLFLPQVMTSINQIKIELCLILLMRIHNENKQKKKRKSINDTSNTGLTDDVTDEVKYKYLFNPDNYLLGKQLI